jgi:hypothetical protein
MKHFFFLFVGFLWNTSFLSLKKFLCIMFIFVLVLIIVFLVIDVTLQKVKTLPSCIGCWQTMVYTICGKFGTTYNVKSSNT